MNEDNEFKEALDCVINALQPIIDFFNIFEVKENDGKKDNEKENY